MKLTLLVQIALLALFCSGCVVLPIPHRRVHALGMKGRVVDSGTQVGIVGAKIKADQPDEFVHEVSSQADGRFTIPAARKWHGAIMIGPLGYSLCPFLGMMPYFHRGIEISAPGYETKRLTIGRSPPGDLSTEETRRETIILDDLLIVGKIELKLKQSKRNYQQEDDVPEGTDP